MHEHADVTLFTCRTGNGPNGARSLEAAVVARSVRGVRAVEDDLRLPAVEH
jgi:hypothetical protein